MHPQSSVQALSQILERVNGSSFAAQQIRGQVGRLYKALTALEAIRTTRNPTETEAAHYRRVAQSAQKLKAEVDAINDRIQAASRSGFEGVEQAIAQRVGLEQDSYGPEIRARFLQMSDTDRSKFLNSAIEGGDAKIVSAIIDAPPQLTGMTPALCSRYREVYIQRHAPQEIAIRDEILDALESGLTGVAVAKQAAASLCDEKKLAQIAQQEQQAMQAASDFNAALGA